MARSWRVSARKIRLAIVVSHPIQHFVHFYRALAECGELDVRVFFCSRIGVEEYLDQDMGATIRWADDLTDGYTHEFLCEAKNIRNTDFRSVNNPSIGDVLKGFAPDIVMIYGYAQITPLRVLIWGRANRVPVLMVTDSNAVTSRAVVKRILRQIILRPLLAQVSSFLTVGDQNEQALAKLGVSRHKIYRSPFTIDEPRYRAARANRKTHREKIRRQYGIAEDTFLGIAVGKLIPRKRTQDAVQAFLDMAKGSMAERGAHLLICGNGPELEFLKNQIGAGDPVTLAGFVNVDRLPEYFAAADVLIHPAGRDAHPLICSEAACIGLPMVLSDRVGTIGPTDISRKDKNALVYPCGDVVALRDNIARLINNPQLFEEMSEASLRIFEECSLIASVNGLLHAVRTLVPQAGQV